MLKRSVNKYKKMPNQSVLLMKEQVQGANRGDPDIVLLIHSKSLRANEHKMHEVKADTILLKKSLSPEDETVMGKRK